MNQEKMMCRKLIFSFVLLVFLAVPLSGQEPEPVIIYTDNEVPYEEVSEDVQKMGVSRTKTANSRCVLLSRGTKFGLQVNEEIILPVEYELKKYIRDSVYVFKRDDREGIYDAIALRWLVPLDVVDVDYVAGNYFIISRGSYSSLIKRDGKVLLHERRQSIDKVLTRDYFIVKRKKEDGTSGTRKALYYAKSQEFVLDFKYKDIAYISHSSFFRVKQVDGYRLYDAANDEWGEDVYDVIYDCIWPSKPRVIVKRNNLCGVIDAQENIVIPIKYKSIKELSAARRMVFVATDENARINVYDMYGRQSIVAIDHVEVLGSDKLRFKKGDKLGLAQVFFDSVVVLLNPSYDKIESAFGKVVVKRDNRFNVFCDRNFVPSEELPYTSYQRLKNRTILVTIDGKVTTIKSSKCTTEEVTEYVFVEDIPQTYPISKPYNYLKAKKEEGDYYLVNGNLVIESQQTFTDILRTKDHYIFFKNEEGKVGVYNGLSDIYVLDAMYDSVEFYGQEIFLTKDDKKGKFRNGKVVY